MHSIVAASAATATATDAKLLCAMCILKTAYMHKVSFFAIHFMILNISGC